MTSQPLAAEVEIVVIGAGVLGIQQLYLAVQAGFSVAVLDEAEGVGGTWFWNRYPDARFDSESYTYGYLFDEELYRDWEWSEEYAGQPEIERYFNHVVDRYDLRKHIHCGARVTSVVYDEETRLWTVVAQDGRMVRARYVVAATGVLSVPVIPDITGRDSFRGEQYHTARWPKEPVSFAGKRVALIGSGSSGTQILPAVAGEVESITLFQRTPNWVTPLNNKPLSAQRQAELRADFQRIRDELNNSATGFLREYNQKVAADDTRERRQELYAQLWQSGGFSKLSGNYRDLLTDPIINAEWCAFIADKIRTIVKDPDVAEKLIPTDHGYSGKRPPYGTGYYEAFNLPTVSLVSLRESPIVRVTETGIETADGFREFDMIIWATGFDFGTGALTRLGVTGRDGRELADHWSDGPRTFLGVHAAGFPNFFFPGGPHGSMGNNPRYGGDQVEYVHDILLYLREHGLDSIEVTAHAEEEWTDLMNTAASAWILDSYFYGSNIPGKPRRQLLNPTGRLKMKELMVEALEGGFEKFHLARESSATPVS